MMALKAWLYCEAVRLSKEVETTCWSPLVYGMKLFSTVATFTWFWFCAIWV